MLLWGQLYEKVIDFIIFHAELCCQSGSLYKDVTTVNSLLMDTPPRWRPP